MDPPSTPSSPSDVPETESEAPLGLVAVRRRVFRDGRALSVVAAGGGESGYADTCERDDKVSSVGVLGDGEGLSERFLLRNCGEGGVGDRCAPCIGRAPSRRGMEVQ